MRKNIIITGGAGYIGQVLSWYLYKRNYLPIIIDRSSQKKIKRKNPKYGKVFNINIRDIDKILRKYKCDTIIHCASNNIVWESKNNPIKYYKSNVSDTIDMLCKAVKYKVKKIIYASSSSVYGSIDVSKKVAEISIDASKKAAEVSIDAGMKAKDQSVKYGKKFIRKKALDSIKEKLEFAQKKETDFTKEEMRNMIAREEKKIIKSLGTTGAVTTILALFGITNF